MAVRDTSWPITTYSYGCQSNQLPNEPACLWLGSFEYSSEFQACRLSVDNYIRALDNYYSCISEKLQNNFQILIEQSYETYNCYVDRFEESGTVSISSLCPGISVEPSYQTYPILTGAGKIHTNYGVPACVRKQSGHDYSPSNTFELMQCKGDVRAFAGAADGRSSAIRIYESAPEQYEKYMRALRREIQEKGNRAVEKFNCMAERRRICL
ncbi:hypothetical protein [Limibacillus halophilus]|uniref:Uncharacterized protein n=1 Tax=Limibacillus halophilus TaxID=1579333 RepID=A0A839SYF5_9PROT|nr:hypothetical protein [Limibacillus halophilus]MBB3066654.1 hypothetical protein [Limibacillus halophilus]